MIPRLGFLVAASIAAYAVKQVNVKRSSSSKPVTKPSENGEIPSSEPPQEEAKDSDQFTYLIDSLQELEDEEEEEKEEVKLISGEINAALNNPSDFEDEIFPESESLLSGEIDFPLPTEKYDMLNKFQAEKDKLYETEMANNASELERMRNLVKEVEEREVKLEGELLEYYGLKEQESDVVELQRQLKIKTVEIDMLNITINSLQAERKRLQEEVSVGASAKKDLEVARNKIKELQRQMQMEATQTKGQLLLLKHQVSGLQEHLSTAWSPELKKKTSEPNMFLRVNSQDHPPTALPTQTRTLQSAPPSFGDRVRPVGPINSITNTRARASSAPSGLDAAEQDGLSVDCEERLNLKSPCGSMKQRHNSNPQPLPLPLPPKAAALKNFGSSKVLNSSGRSNIAGPLPLPLPPPLPLSQPSTSPQSLPSIGKVRNFSFEELATACNNFCPGRYISGGPSSMIYRATFGDDSLGFRKLEATVTRLNPSSQGLNEFLKEVNTLGCLQHPYLCQLIGFHARAECRMLVYERLYRGSLDRLLYGRSDGPFLDWPARMKVAICAAKGLTYLHEDGPLQVMFHEFSTGNIQIDKDYTAKLSGYGCASHIPETHMFSNSVAPTSLLVEVQNEELLTPKSNVRSFGIVLLDLLTGKRTHDNHRYKEERNLVKWIRPYSSDDGRLSLIMDPQLQGRFPAKAAHLVADIVHRCLQADPSKRPTMRTILEHLKVIQQMKFTSQFPLPEPGSVRGKTMSRSPSVDGIITPGPQLSISTSQKARLCVSPSRPFGLPLSLPRQSCSSTPSSEEPERRGGQL